MTTDRSSQALLIVIALLIGFQASLLYQIETGSLGGSDGTDTRTDIGQNITIEQHTFNVTGTQGDLYNAIFRSSKDAVVSIVSLDGGEVQATGSGFVYDRQGRIVTNNHVIQGAERVQIRFLNGNVHQGEVIGRDPYTDLAVIDIDTGMTSTPLPLGNSTELKIGDSVLAIGNPFGLSGSMTAGIVSQKGRTLPAANQFSIPNVIQTDAAINPGNSGGPLLNIRGEVIGINTAIDSTSQTFQGVGFAVPVNAVRRVVPSLIANGTYEHPWIGISGIDVTPQIADAMDLENATGFMVVTVREDSPASRAGLRGAQRNATVRGNQVGVGGDVIVGVDGQPVRQLDDLLGFLATDAGVGEQIQLQVIRDGERMTVPLTLAARPPA